MIQAIVTYKYRGCRGAVGQTVGADGAGIYARVFTKTVDTLRPFVQKIAVTTGISEIHVIEGEEYFTGDAITYESTPNWVVLYNLPNLTEDGMNRRGYAFFDNEEDAAVFYSQIPQLVPTKRPYHPQDEKYLAHPWR